MGIKRLFPLPYQAAVLAAAKTYDLPPALLYALIKAESNFNPAAVSPKGAKGLTQMLESTAIWCSKESGLLYTDLANPDESIPLGAYYLRFLLDMYDGQTDVALAAYNAGHGRVDRWLSDSRYAEDGEHLSSIPFPETERYVRKVLLYQKVYEKRLVAQKKP